MHTQNRYFPDPFQFKPERWIPEEQNELEYNDLEAFSPFSAGYVITAFTITA
jgi:cytochrome P450